ncbi:uncharacterized protein Gasu_39110 [Galdieria sulphuraria]|uniref:Uncharacterized protein n=1 Tax=Galdieria sulphuraria TaxID=130081 RepID=M2XEW5_GALSU|nr:uncharacterized protein Gasu_39110 [Galdieria sulphuraria]EME28532.1 hypothetical protein Gasu_39110 [Galdieria sulphuraria]|eukprot:XP_005705052.1 hypothetical protein Gasu_39110 [Galdieria sulphuraria]
MRMAIVIWKMCMVENEWEEEWANLERCQFEVWMGNCDLKIAMGENEWEGRKDWGQLQLGRKGANPESDCDFEIAIIVGGAVYEKGRVI